MTSFKMLTFSGLVLSLAATGWAYGQSATPAAPPTATAPQPGTAMPEIDADDASTLPDDDDDDEGLDGADASETASDGDVEKKGRPGRMGRMDADGDGAIGKTEFRGRQAERLRAADADGDGTLSKPELEAMVLKEIVERRTARLERRLDVDGDGRVTLAEIDKMRDKRFALYDRNDDGRLDGGELRALHRGMGPGEMRGGDRRGPSAHRRHDEHHGRHGGEGWRERHGDRGYE